MKPASVYVHDLTSALGERTETVEEAAARGLTFSSARALREAGFAEHRLCAPQTSAYDLARRAVSTLGAATDGTSAIVYSTCLPLNANLGDPAELERSRDVKVLMEFPASRLQSELGLHDAAVIGLDQQACTGLLGSIRLARALLVSEPGLGRILCVTADRFPSGAAYEQSYSLISDGASAFMVSREPLGYRVLACRQITNGALAAASDDEAVGCFFAYTHRLVRETVAAAGLEVEDVDWIVPQNTSEKAWEILARLLGIDRERVFYETLPRVAHVIGGDNVINLIELEAQGRVARGDRVLLVVAGYGLNWQGVLLEKA